MDHDNQTNLTKAKQALKQNGLQAKISDTVKSRIATDYEEIKTRKTEPSFLVHQKYDNNRFGTMGHFLEISNKPPDREELSQLVIEGMETTYGSIKDIAFSRGRGDSKAQSRNSFDYKGS